MDLRQLECFFAVADERHFGRAAARLNLGQPTVSEAVKRLETSIGGRLFYRHSRMVALTPVGERFLPAARSAYEALAAARAQAVAEAANDASSLAVGYVEDLAQPLLAKVPDVLRAQSPSLVIRPSVVPTLQQAEALRSGAISVGLGWDTPHSPGIRRHALVPDPYVVILHAQDSLARRRTVEATDLAGRSLVMWPASLNPAHRAGFLHWVGAPSEQVDVEHEAVGTSNIVTLVLAGHGVGVTTQSVASSKRVDGVVYRGLGPSGPCARRILTTRNDPQSPAVRLLTALLKQASAATTRQSAFLQPAPTQPGPLD